MEALDLKSTIVAAAVGAVILYLAANYREDTPTLTVVQSVGLGALVGAGVQTVVRLTGVS